jgi:hypothetical protein
MDWVPVGVAFFILGAWFGISLPFALVIVRGLRKIEDSEPTRADKYKVALGDDDIDQRMEELLETRNYTTSLEEWSKRKKEGQHE